MKYIILDYHFMLEKVAIGSLQVSHVSTQNQLADIFIKLLLRSRFTFFWSKISVSNGNTILQGILGENQSHLQIKSTKWSILKFTSNICIPCIVYVYFEKSYVYLKGCSVQQ